MLATLIADRWEADSLGLVPGVGGGGGDSGSVGSIRGVQMVMRNRARFLTAPEARWAQLNDKIKARMLKENTQAGWDHGQFDMVMTQ